MSNASSAGRLNEPGAPESEDGRDEPAVALQITELLVASRRMLRARHYARRTEEAYLGWIRRFAEYHTGRALDSLHEREVHDFVSYLANELGCSASTHRRGSFRGIGKSVQQAG